MVLAFESLMLCNSLVTHLLQPTFWFFPNCFTICGLSIQICASMGSILIQNNTADYLSTVGVLYCYLGVTVHCVLTGEIAPLCSDGIFREQKCLWKRTNNKQTPQFSLRDRLTTSGLLCVTMEIWPQCHPVNRPMPCGTWPEDMWESASVIFEMVSL